MIGIGCMFEDTRVSGIAEEWALLGLDKGFEVEYTCSG